MTRETRNLWDAFHAAAAEARRAGLCCLEMLSLDAQGVDPECATLAVYFAQVAGREALTVQAIRPALLARLRGDR